MKSIYVEGIQASLKNILQKVPVPRLFLRFLRILIKTVRRDPLERLHRERFVQFKQQYGRVLRHRLNSAGRERKIALVTSPVFPEVEIEVGLIKGLELAGFEPVVLIPDGGELLLKYYRLAGVKKVHFWNEFADSPNFDLAAAEAVIDRHKSIEDLLRFEYEGARVGRLAVSSALRRLKLGSLNVHSPQDRQVLTNCVAKAMTYAKAAKTILRKYRPDLALLVNTVYVRGGELFDNCLASGVHTIMWQCAHKSNALMLKRYTLENKDEHPCSLSLESCQLVRNMEWTDVRREQIDHEFYSNYANGDWYSVVGTQFNKRFIDADEIRSTIGLDRRKKTAVIFPHILWDAALFWGKCLFANYEEWLIETVRAACANDQVNWVIKIHPANVGKRVREGFKQDFAEVVSLRKHFGDLPPHVFTIPAESDISTLSLFQIMDYCVTVYGTVSIEAARLGIPVLTAGTGLHSHDGFTIDSESREQYLGRLAYIHEIQRISPSQRELAERHAYGIFVLRPFRLVTATLDYHNNEKMFSTKGQINVRTKEDWYNASDLRAFAHWITSSRHSDFVIPLPEKQDPPLLSSEAHGADCHGSHLR